VAVQGGTGTEGHVPLPFEWTGVELYATGATELRIRIELDDTDTGLRLWATDPTGQPLLHARGLRLRPADSEQLRAAATPAADEHLYRVEFQAPRALEEAPAQETWVLGGNGEMARALDAQGIAQTDGLFARLDEGIEPPGRVVVDTTGNATSNTMGNATGEAADNAIDDALGATADALVTAQRLLAEPRLENAEFVWVTRSAVDAGDGIGDLVRAPLWGLLRAVRAEHPERVIQLVDLDANTNANPDTDTDTDTNTEVPFLVDEPEVVVRGGRVRVGRLVRAAATDNDSNNNSSNSVAGGSGAVLDPSGAVLITGGTGELGRAVAGHLVRVHGVRHLVLTSRRGQDAPGAQELTAELTAAGAETVRLVACDVSDRDQIAAVLADTDTDDARPWTGIFHLAAVLDDGLLTAQSPQRLARVWAPKATGARHLHDLSLELGLDLAAFVLFSSAAGVLGGPGQSNYAAANACLDALAVHRRALGLPATSVSWGLWQQAGTGLTADLGRAELARLRRMGIGALTPAQALTALDAALVRTDAHLVPVKFVLDAFRREDGHDVPALLRGLVRAPRRRADATATAGRSGLRDRLAALPGAERSALLVQIVQREAAAVLGMSDSGAIGKDQVFKDLGFDSLMAVELRRRLSAETGTPLPSTLAFDHPTPAAVAALLLERLSLSDRADEPSPAAPVRREGTASDDPIAIVSMACRLPGGVTTPEEYWTLLAEGTDAVGPLPSRWDGLDLYDPDPDAVGKSYAREGGFIDGVEDFDATFFGISPREALSMDPQQRLVLETAWEALERAGIRPDSLRGSATAVYVGTMGSDYDDRNGGALQNLNGYVGTGNAASVISGRVSYTLGLQGPAVTVDTACSSSLVALHLAAASLRQGECELALVGGVTVMSTPATFVEFSRLRAMATDGRCRSFSATGDGAGWSEGVGVLVLKRLSAAERDGDRVLALVRGSAVNQDGASNGLTAPNGPSQQRVIRDALAASRLAPADIDAVEAHGTGTDLGDPIEAGALAEVFGSHRLFLGSAKSNLGHTQAAAGIVGVMKMVLALQHETLPRTLHAEEPSPHIDWAASSLTLLQEARPWPHEEGRTRRTGVSAFGIGGTNAHVVLEEAPQQVDAPSGEPGAVPVSTSVGAWPLLLSGYDEEALRAQAGRWAEWLAGHDGTPLSDVVRTAALHRTHLPARASLDVADMSEAVRALSALAAGEPHDRVVVGDARERDAVVFVCPDPSADVRWDGVGRALLSGSEVFADAVGACDAVLRPLTGWSVREVLAGEAAGGPDVAGPAGFALAVGLGALWKSLGIEPAAVVGHGLGETVASVVRGELPLDEGARIVTGNGAGTAVDDGSPGGAAERFEAHGHELRVRLAPNTDPGPATEPGTGSGVETDIETGIRTGVETGVETGIEISTGLSPAGVLRSLGVLHAQGYPVDWSRVPGASGAVSLVALPTYAFRRDRYWSEPGTVHTGASASGTASGTASADVRSAGVRSAGLLPSAHPWVGATLPLAGGEGHLLTGLLSSAGQPWLADHAAFGVAIVPGTGMLELALTAAAEAGFGGVEQLTLLEPLPIDPAGAERVQVVVGAADAGGRATVTVHSQSEGTDRAWTRHAVGVLSPPGAGRDGATAFPDLTRWPVAGAEQVDLDGFYERFRERDLDYGPAFRGLVELWRDGDTAYGRICLPEGLRADEYRVHPALLDAALHACMGARREAEGETPVLFPFEWSGVELSAVGSAELRVRVDVDESGTGLRLWAADADGSPVLSGELRLREVTAEQVRGAARPEHLYRVELREVNAPTTGTGAGTGTIDGGIGVGVGSDASRVVVDARDWTGTVTEVATRGLIELQRLFTENTGNTGNTGNTETGITTETDTAADAEVVWLTSGAVGDDGHDLAQAALWGLVRATRSEFPDRTVRLVDTTGADLTGADLTGADLSGPVAAALGSEAELVVRDGTVYTPRLVAVPGAESPAPVLDPDGVVLITGGTGELGRAVAEHLVREYGVRHLLLTSRRGLRAPGMDEAVAGLTAAGVRTVDVVACDVADRESLAAVLADATSDRPLTGVFHLAAVVDDGLLGSQNPERLTRVLAAKTESALHLHELTLDLAPAVFVLFSSAAGLLGTAGQSTYAAANTALDALAAYRHGLGLPGTSLSWGLWEQGGLSRTASLGRADLARMSRQGFGALDRAEALAALDSALRTPHPHLVPVKLTGTGSPSPQQHPAGSEKPPVLLRDLVRVRPQATGTGVGTGAGARTGTGAGTAAVLAGTQEQLTSPTSLSGAELREALVELVRAEATTVLGLSSTILADQRFQKLGLDSLTAVELRRRLTAATGTTLPSTVAFEHPTPERLADRLMRDLDPDHDTSATPAAPAATPTEQPVPVTTATTPSASPMPSARPARSTVRPATEGQKRLWFLERLDPGSAQYNATMTLHLNGALDREAFERSVLWLMERHEALRTGLESRDGQLVQVVHENVDAPVTYRDATGLSADEARALLHAEELKPFAVSGRTLLRLFVLTTDTAAETIADENPDKGDSRQSVCLTMHHAITDGWSIALLLSELTDAYRAFRSGTEPDRSAPAGCPGDLAAQEEEALRTGLFDEGVHFFREQLAGVPRLEFPPGPGTAPESGGDSAGGTVHFTIPAGLRSGVEELASDRSVTPYTVLVSAFAVLLGRVTGQDDFGLGTVWANRQLPEAEGMVGFLANTLPLRCDLTGDPAFDELIGSMAPRVLGTMEHQAVPLTEVVRAVGGPRTGDENPLFRCLFNYASMPMAAQGNEFWRLSTEGSLAGNVDGAAKFDLGLTLLPFGDGLRGELEYRPEVWAAGAARRLVDGFLTLLPALLSAPGRPVGEAALLAPAELAWLEERGGRVVAAAPDGPTALDLVLAQARRTPDAVALVSDGQELTYRRTVSRAADLADLLRSAGVGAESLVGVHLPRSVDLVVAVLAVWMAGGAYV
ncbi:SDR family NAD(P)-dependent oxidoreductase, partial [Streptomyces sp. NPDC057496]|uniref:SDR family NAD(P)-dependent oxidoreductase n=1 Tax=Streptomyces sp. NPDC057496 TaxID=3346149 RepID=UPI0036B94688